MLKVSGTTTRLAAAMVSMAGAAWWVSGANAQEGKPSQPTTLPSPQPTSQPTSQPTKESKTKPSEPAPASATPTAPATSGQPEHDKQAEGGKAPDGTVQPALEDEESVQEIIRRLKEQASKSGAKFEEAKPAPKAPDVMQPAATPGTKSDLVGDGMVRLEFTEAVDVMLLVKFVRETLGIQLIINDNGLQNAKVTFTEPLVIPRDKLLPFLVEVLEDRDYSIQQNSLGLYVIKPKNALTPTLGPGEYMTTRVIRTPNIRPSTIQGAVTNLLNTNRVGGVTATAPTYMDDLGLLILTETPRNTALVQSLVDTLVAEREKIKYERFELNHIAAVSARDRVLELMGQSTRAFGGQAQPGQAPQPVIPGGASNSITNLAEKMTIDSASNSIIFRGRTDEARMLSEMLTLVDVPNALVSKFYPVGTKAAEAVANAGTREQLGGVTSFESSGGGRSGVSGRTNPALVNPGGGGGAFNNQQESPGAGFVLYPEAGGFIYRGTASQHARVTALIASLREISDTDTVTIEFYKLKHGKAEDVASIIQNLLTNTVGSANSGGLLGRGAGGSQPNRANIRQGQSQRDIPAANAAAAAPAAGESGLNGELGGEDVFVIADEPNNQIVVKAPRKLHPQFKQLIQRIDLRRPQVYLDAKIVVVTSTDALDLAVEAQQIIGQFAFNTNFGLGTLTSTTTSGTGTGATTTTTGGLQSVKTPSSTLPGGTAALIRSKDVPLLINALARDVDGRVVATPQLLVDDNSEAEIKSKDQQPTSTTSQSGQAGSTVTGFGGFEEAGPSLRVKPQISEGGYMRLDYEIELSSFTGAPQGGLPSPKQTNNIKSESVTVPSDATIVVGGLVSESSGKTILKIPLLGDIPLIGALFQDQSYTKTKTTLFVFITPKIIRDPTFQDLRLITKAPLVALDLPSETPPPEPMRIDVLDTAREDSRERDKALRDENRKRSTGEQKGKNKAWLE